MTDRPIIFSAPMVRALLDGSKRQTRRLALARCKVCGSSTGTCNGPHRPTPWTKVTAGDRLWVRENLGVGYYPRRLWFTADNAGAPDAGFDFGRHYPRIAVPSIHMSRWASRLTLVVTAARVERLQDISDADAQAEGVIEDKGDMPGIWYVPGTGGVLRGMSPLTADRPSKVFAGLWRALHGAESWNANPEVVALTFRVEQANVDTACDCGCPDNTPTQHRAFCARYGSLREIARQTTSLPTRPTGDAHG